MPNIRISDMPLAIAPLTGAELMEIVQDGFSKKTTITDLLLGLPGFEATFLTLSASAALPNERILTAGAGISFVDGGPGGTLIISAAGAGVASVNSGTNITVDNADPANPIINLNAAITGTSVNGVTLSNAGAATDFLNEQGNYVAAGGSIPDPLIIGSINLTSALTPAAAAPYDNVPINIGANLVGTQPMTQLARQIIQARPSGFGFNATLFINTSGGDVQIGNLNQASVHVDAGVAVNLRHGVAATIVAQTTTVAAGGLLANNQATGAGLERVLTTADLGGSVPDPLIIGSINLTSALIPSAAAPYTNVPINIGANLVGTQPMTQLARQRIQTRPSGFGFNATLFINDQGGDVQVGNINQASVHVDAGVAVNLRHAVAATIVAQTTSAAAGGLLANNQATGAGLERVLTTADLGGAISQIENGGNVVAIALASGVLGVRSVGNTDTEGRAIQFQHTNGTERGMVGYITTDDLNFIQRIHGALTRFYGEDTGGVLREMIRYDGDNVVNLGVAGTFRARTADPTANDLSTGFEVADAGGAFHPAGYNGMPPHLEAGGYIFRKEEVGKMVYSTEGALQVYNTNQETDVEAGATWGLAKPSGGNLTLAPGAGVTLRHFAPDGTVTSVTFGGSFTLAVGFVGAVYKLTDIEYWFWGNDTVT